MKGVSFDFNNIDKRVSMVIDPGQCDSSKMESSRIKQFFECSPYGDHLLDEDALDAVIKTVVTRIKEANSAEVSSAIALQVDAKLTIDVEIDSMTVNATIESAHGGDPVKVEEVHARLSLLGIARGISAKRIKALVKESRKLQAGHSVCDMIAKGLPPRKGKNSRVKTIVNDASTREFTPQSLTRHRVDMRNLGQIVAVKENEVIAKILPPKPGRNGYDVYGRELMAQVGEHVTPKLGNNTAINPKNDQEIIATVCGQPKFRDDVLYVDDVYTVNGVNVKTGNIDYNGAVVVNGDVTESMRVVASGDVTINGFVESAFIKTDGNIIITEGITGKQDADDCLLDAAGSISVGHAQHVNIVTQRDLLVTKQLSHSTIACGGDLIVGKSRELIDGSLIACRIVAGGLVCAGKVGAVSGSRLIIDYSDAVASQREKLQALNELRLNLASNTSSHEDKLEKISGYGIEGRIKDKIMALRCALDEQKSLLEWIEITENESTEKLRVQMEGLQIQAHRKLYSGVKIIMGHAELEIDKTVNSSIIFFDDEQIMVVPFNR